MIYRVVHKTQYRYNEPVLLSFNEARLKPRPCGGQGLIESTMTFHPSPRYLRERVDFAGNFCHFFSIEEPHDSLEVISESLVKITPRATDFLASMPAWEEIEPFLEKESFREVRQYRLDSPHIKRSAALSDYARISFEPRRPFLDAVLDLNGRIYREFQYAHLSTTLNTSPEEVLVSRQGVCQDFAHVMIGCLRSLGFAARYVSGYIETIKSPEKPHLTGADASHAWVSVYFPKIGWFDFDPTNNQMTRHQHITVAWGRDYADIIPLRGVYRGSAFQTVSVEVLVEPKESADGGAS